ncbi:MAG: spvB [Ferruginibacter sp.]|uniref:SpvB/TcaC N-terminal domain-containing protein n=1 Tax=Ferruginibacter sp. TaxID=1940288 RepID=UPI002657E387|nr:SpvB/TcaC N-terminal domain-containing protein [Ferruginibacter sp.]MDB5279413.1 spvB [Ferruginibacter sp.]
MDNRRSSKPTETNTKPATGFQQNNTADNFVQQTPSVTLPKGGGALKNIDDKFNVNAANGTAAVSFAIPFSTTRSNFVPAMSLNYNSGSGNGEFGLGWSLDLPAIQRKTDKRLPEYKDAEESDIFMFTGVEDLVPQLKKDGTGNWQPDEVTEPLTGYTIKRYRPRIEGSFHRIERITPKDAATFYWKVTDRNNIVTIYGRSPAAQIFNPANQQQIFKWLPQLSYDDKGNCFELTYLKDDFKNVPTVLSERNRLNGNAPCTNSYLKQVQYGNENPYFPDFKNPYDPPFPANPAYFYAAVLDFGDHDELIPTPVVQRDWPCRTEPFSHYKTGFEIRNYRLCRRMLFFHFFKELNDGINAAPTLVRSLDISYQLFLNPSATTAQKRNAEADYIISLQESGYIKKQDSSYSKKSMPPLEFTYQELNWNKTVQTISPENLANDPVGLSTGYQWTDLYSEGIAGILTEQANAWYYKSNLGDGNFTNAQPVIPKPSYTGIANGALQLQDLEADGRKFIVSLQQGTMGYFELNEDAAWQPFRSFQQMPNIKFTDANTKLIDLDGDGRADLIVSEENVFTWYASKGIAGYDSAELATKMYDEEHGPSLIFADNTQSVFLLDMTGDGLTDIVRIRNGEICYWPNMGFGKFGAKVNMDFAPWFDGADQFNAAYLHLADISGTGATDLIYLGKNQCGAWINLGGNAWGEVQPFDGFPTTEQPNQMGVMDLLGNGTACIVWSSPLQKYAASPMRYIDLMGGNKPYIMKGFKNNFGEETSWEYKSSTQYYLADKQAGKPWITKLPFPVQCVAKTIVKDAVAGTQFTNAYVYHHGYYDHAEREFRGFGKVEQLDTEDFTSFKLSNANNVVEEDLHQPPAKTVTWFHTGGWVNEQKILDQFNGEYNKGPFEFDLPKPLLPAGLTADENREAFRACKGMALRQEVYAMDGTADEDKPYKVSTHNVVIKLLQPASVNKFAVFLSHESEAISVSYERNLDDPRIAHSLNLETDDFGNVLQSASVVYGRKQTDAQLPAGIQAEQNKVHVIYTTNDYTNLFDVPETYRLKALAETKTYELTQNTYNAVTAFSINQLLADFAVATMIAYETAANGTLQKRLIEDVRVIYLDNDLVTPLPLLQIDTLGFTSQTYKLAFTPSLVTSLYGTKVVNQMLTDSKYVQADGTNWWLTSGRNIYLTGVETAANAKQRFYLPVASKDPFDIETKLFYDDYHLILTKTIDALQNTASAETIDYRTIQPVILKDLNNNISEVITDELGMVIATSLHGSEGDGNHGDLPLTSYNVVVPADLNEVVNDPHKFLEQATAFFYYDLLAWMNRSQPVCFANVVRETHESELSGGNPSKVSLSVGYSNGMGNNLQTKIQAEPGKALQWQGNNLVTVDTSPRLRWVGSGRTILNNKGNPVKQYEPFFSTTFEYESEAALVEIGFSSVLYYDPLNRNILAKHANGTFSKTEFDSWKQLTWDENDTVLESQWYADRGSPNPAGPEPNNAEQRAAWLAAKHANTPAQQHVDSLGLTIYTIADNGPAGKYATEYLLDIENNLRTVIDARNNSVMQYSYNMASQQLYQNSMDGGERLVFNDVLGKAVFTWDNRDHRIKTEYDLLHRPLKQWLKEKVQDNNPEKLIHFSVYGENQPNDQQLNLRGKLFQSFDQSGLTETAQYDFKGNVKISNRKIASEYKQVVDWNVADPMLLLEQDNFGGGALFDALNRATEVQLPDGSKIHPAYNEAGLLEQLDVFVKSQNQNILFVQNIDYNAKAQRERILYGNNTATRYEYDEKTYHLTRLLTTRNNGADIMQDLNYTFDPVANITTIGDNAQQTIYFNNALVEASNKFEYDAVYRLIYAQGREHAGQNAASDQFDADKTQFNNQRLTLPGDMNAMQRYEEQYSYDEVGNMISIVHNAGNGVFKNKWTSIFTCNGTDNRLMQTKVGANSTGYSYDAHGNLQNLQNGHFGLAWNYADQLQQVDLGGGGTAYYVYDSNGQRVRKVIENGNLVKERIYLNTYELYREKQNNVVSTARETLHIMDDKQRIALIETRTSGEDNGLPFLIRYQYTNHLGTACLELDNNAAIISYEEYYPFGSTAFQAMRNQTETAKRYRYTGKERDEESGLYYHGARYYAPWLARWTAVDPTGIKDGINDYVYCSNNPVLKKDLNGMDGGTWTTTYDANGQPVYSSTGDQAKKDLGKVGGTVGKLTLDTDLVKGLKKSLVDPRLNELTTSLKADWDKDKAPLIVGGVLILVPIAVALGAIAVQNPKLDVPIIGNFYPRQGVTALASLGVETLTSKLTDDRFKLGFSYEKKDDKTDVYGFELTLSGKKPPEDDKKDNPDEKKSPEKQDPASAGTTTKTNEQKQQEALRKEIEAPASLTVGAKFGGGGGEGSIKLEKPTAIGRFTVAPALKVAPQAAPNFTTNLTLTTSLLGNRVEFGASLFVNNPASKDSPFDVKYDDKTNLTTVTTAPPLRGTGGFLGVQGSF